jgi:hypothetical protein
MTLFEPIMRGAPVVAGDCVESSWWLSARRLSFLCWLGVEP